MDRETLAGYGIDYDKGLSNCMGDAEFFRTLLSMFLDDDCFARAQAAYAARDYKELFSCVHELKGVSGNAALTALYASTVPLVEFLRNGRTEDGELEKLFTPMENAYQRVREGIERMIASGR